MPEIVTIDGVIGWDVTAKDVRDQLASAKGKDIEVQISSPGGSVTEGITIFNLIRAHEGEKSTNIVGLAASMGSYIALATDKVNVADNAVYMIHNAWNFAIGDHHELRKTANRLESVSKNLSRAYVKKTGQSIDEIQSMMDDETWLFGQEIVDAGFADSIQGGEGEEKDEALAFAKLTWDECNAKLKDQDQKEDLERAAALFKAEKPTTSKKTPKGAPKMTPEEIAAMQKENERLTAELEAAKVEPVAEVAEPVAKVDEPEKDVAPLALASQVLRSTEYPEAVKAKAEEFIKGEATEENFKMIVSMADMLKEQLKSTEAVAESGAIQDTPGVQNEPTGLDKEGNATSAKGIYALGANLKAELDKKNGTKKEEV